MAKVREARFYKTGQTTEPKLVSINLNSNRFIPGNIQNSSSKYAICPYTPYIPLAYIFCYDNPMNVSGRNNISNNQSPVWNVSQFQEYVSLSQNPLGNLTEDYIRNYGWSSNNMAHVQKGIVNEYLRFDRPVGIEHIQNRVSYKSDIVNCIRNGTPSKADFRSWKGVCSFGSLITEEYGAIFQAVILPENYEAVKLEFLLTGNINTDYVIILINKEIDSPQFPNASLRTIYRKDLEPILFETFNQIYKVPKEYIEEMCFLQGFKLRETNIVRRKAEINAVIDEFRGITPQATVSRNEVYTPSGVNRDAPLPFNSPNVNNEALLYFDQTSNVYTLTPTDWVVIDGVPQPDGSIMRWITTRINGNLTRFFTCEDGPIYRQVILNPNTGQTSSYRISTSDSQSEQIVIQDSDGWSWTTGSNNTTVSLDNIERSTLGLLDIITSSSPTITNADDRMIWGTYNHNFNSSSEAVDTQRPLQDLRAASDMVQAQLAAIVASNQIGSNQQPNLTLLQEGIDDIFDYTE